MTVQLRKFNVAIPQDGATKWVSIKIPMEWDEDVSEWLMTEEGLRQVQETKEGFFTEKSQFQIRTKIHPDVFNICRDFNAWVVGSAADPYIAKPNDCDIIVEPEHFNFAVNYLSGEKSLNKFNGIRAKYGGEFLDVDLWQSSLTNYINNSNLKAEDGEDIFVAWNPITNMRIFL